MTNAVLENIKSRRSVRKYKPDMVPDDLLNKVIEAGTLLQAAEADSHQLSLPSKIKSFVTA